MILCLETTEMKKIIQLASKTLYLLIIGLFQVPTKLISSHLVKLFLMYVCNVCIYIDYIYELYNIMHDASQASIATYSTLISIVSLVFAEKKAEGRSRIDREADNNQLLQLEEKDVVSSVATVLSDLCGPGEWMPMEKLHAEVSFTFNHNLSVFFIIIIIIIYDFKHLGFSVQFSNSFHGVKIIYLILQVHL